MPTVYLLVCVLIQPSFIVSTYLLLSLQPPHHVWHDHVVVYPLPLADPVQHALIHPIVYYHISQHAAAHLTPVTMVCSTVLGCVLLT